MEAIKEAGLRIPDDIAIAGIDDVHESAFGHPPLTTFHMPRHDMGVIAMRKLHNLISADRQPPAKTILYGELIVRGTTVGNRDDENGTGPGL
jgi:DNA-binding LacI/PurR family transcriptional regulator